MNESEGRQRIDKMVRRLVSQGMTVANASNKAKAAAYRVESKQAAKKKGK